MIPWLIHFVYLQTIIRWMPSIKFCHSTSHTRFTQLQALARESFSGWRQRSKSKDGCGWALAMCPRDTEYNFAFPGLWACHGKQGLETLHNACRVFLPLICLLTSDLLLAVLTSLASSSLPHAVQTQFFFLLLPDWVSQIFLLYLLVFTPDAFCKIC